MNIRIKRRGRKNNQTQPSSVIFAKMLVIFNQSARKLCEAQAKIVGNGIVSK